MGRYKKGIQGPFSGKIGSVVGASWRGVDYMRSLPERSKKAPTEKQLKQQKKFALVYGWLKPIRDMIWLGYQQFKGRKTPMNVAVSFHMLHAVKEVDNEFNIDFANVVLSRGELLPSFVQEITSPAEDTLKITWKDVPYSAFCRSDDGANFIVYNPAKNKFVTFEDIAKRDQKEAVLSLPSGFVNNSIRVWMNYASADKEQVSTSVYLLMSS